MRDDRHDDCPDFMRDAPGDDDKALAAKCYARSGYRAWLDADRAYDDVLKIVWASLFLTVASAVSVIVMLGEVEGRW